MTCPLIRLHPALVAQATATMGRLMPGRFFLGVGTGENLNEHVVGGSWPPPEIRQDMLEEAVGVIRSLLAGGEKSHHGRFYEVVDARLYTLPEQPVPIYVAASSKESGKLAGRVGDGLVCSSVSKEAVQAFNEAGGEGRPRIGQLTVCWAADERQAIEIALEVWPNGALSGTFKAELPRPAQFMEVMKTVRPEDVAKEIVCGPDPRRHLEAIGEYAKAGFDHVYVHQVGPDQEGFFRFYEREVMPNLGQMAA